MGALVSNRSNSSASIRAPCAAWRDNITSPMRPNENGAYGYRQAFDDAHRSVREIRLGPHSENWMPGEAAYGDSGGIAEYQLTWDPSGLLRQ